MFNRWFVFVFALTVMFTGRECWSASEQPQGKSSTYFSQGQAVFDPQNRDKSKRDAIQDFQVHAITQAIGSFLTPSQMGSQFGSLQEKILKQSGRYIETYQVFSETAASGLYRVTGQVTVLLDALKKDLMQLGFAVGEPSRASTSSAVQGAKTSSGPAVFGDQEEPRGRPRGTAGSKQEVLWLVAERWDREWNLPRDRRDPRALLATSVAQESQDYEWAVSLPESEPLTPDESGNVSSAQALSVARKMSIQKIVLGTMDLRQGRNQEPLLDVNLRILTVSTGKSQGEIRRQLNLGDGSDQEGAMELATLIVPQLDRLLREPSQAQAQPTAAAQSVASPPSARGAGEWTLLIDSDHQYAVWEELEKLLRDRFKSMRVASLELGAGEAKVVLEGIDGQSLTTLAGTQIRGGMQIEIGEVSPEEHSIRVTFVRSGQP